MDQCTEPYTKAFVQMSRALAYEKKGDRNRAVKDVQSALEYANSIPKATRDHPCNNYGFLEKCARLYVEMKCYGQALELYNLSYGGTERLIERGDLYLLMGQPELALADYTSALTRKDEMLSTFDSVSNKWTEHPFGAIVYAKRSNAYSAMGKSELAAADKTQAQKLLLAKLPVERHEYYWF